MLFALLKTYAYSQRVLRAPHCELFISHVLICYVPSSWKTPNPWDWLTRKFAHILSFLTTQLLLLLCLMIINISRCLLHTSPSVGTAHLPSNMLLCYHRCLLRTPDSDRSERPLFIVFRCWQFLALEIR